MKVKDLIKALEAHDPEMIVVKDGYEGGLVEILGSEIISALLNVNTEWYYGPHEEASGDREGDALVLRLK